MRRSWCSPWRLCFPEQEAAALLPPHPDPELPASVPISSVSFLSTALVIFFPPLERLLTCHWLPPSRRNSGTGYVSGDFPSPTPPPSQRPKHGAHEDILDPSLGTPLLHLFTWRSLSSHLAEPCPGCRRQTISVPLPFQFSFPLFCSLGTLFSFITQLHMDRAWWGVRALGSRVLVLSFIGYGTRASHLPSLSLKSLYLMDVLLYLVSKVFSAGSSFWLMAQ